MSQDHQECTVPPTNDKHDVEKAVPSPPSNRAQERPYSIYTPAERWFIVVMASVAALFSPLAAMTYMPAIPVIATDFHKSVELINLTVTVYMVFQGISPVFWGTLADYVGRRPIFLSCMLVLTVACIGLASTPTSDYWLLLMLRCVQAAGSASTVALGAGVIGDIATRAERGSFFGLFSVGPLFGPTFGPVIGGVLTQTLGWRWIFWILAIASALCFVALLVFFPETLRQLVGDGSVLPSRFYRPLVPLVGHGRRGMTTERPPRVPFVNPLRILTYPDVLALLLFNAVQYAVFYAIIATISTIFQSTYSFLNETETGLCFLASGLGTIIGGYVIGKILDRDYRLLKEKLAREHRITTDTPGSREAIVYEENFPIEKARLKTIPIQLLICIVCCAGYGWCLHQKVNIAVPLVLQFIFCFSVMAILNTTQTLLVDLLPTQGSSVTACNNLVRCALGAACVSVIDLMLNGVGVGWTYTILALISLSTSPMIWLILWLGPRSRAKRRARNN
ncbi:major facilitator superfamily domain-containing protein [Pisolithus tinctorius]|nr:major facilitator superfamily domain-containing protein [Pisolithus tinctorius]